MKKTFVLLAVLCLFFSCKTDKKKGTKTDNVVKTETETTPPEEVFDDALEVPEDIQAFLDDKMEGYEMVSKEEWLSEEYLEGFSNSTRPRYNEDILIEGDFNGDGEDDFATFLKDKNGNINLYAFHKNGDIYKRYLLKKEGQPDYLGAGLEVEAPGFVYGGNKEVGLEYNGIIYNIYEKTGTTYYYDSGRYKSVLTSD